MEISNSKNGKKQAVRLQNSSKIDVVEAFSGVNLFPFLMSILYIAIAYRI